jgi:hypothetical protein
VGREGEDRPLVGFQHFEPGSKIGGMLLAGLGRKPKIGRQVGGGDLRDELLLGVALIAPFLAPIMPTSGLCRMA